MQSTDLIERFSSINIDCDDDLFLEQGKGLIMEYWEIEKKIESLKVQLKNERNYYYKLKSIKRKQRAELENQQTDKKIQRLSHEVESFKTVLIPVAKKLNIRLGENPLLVQEQKLKIP